MVLNLVHRQQAVLADRFHADIDVEDARLGRELEQLVVVIRVDRPQAREPDVERLQRAEQFLRELVLAGDLIVDELEAAEAGDRMICLISSTMSPMGRVR